MAQVGLEPWPSSQASTLRVVPAGRSVNWLCSLLFNNVHLFNMYETMYIGNSLPIDYSGGWT